MEKVCELCTRKTNPRPLFAFPGKAKRFAFVGFLHLLNFSGISGDSEQKNISQTITHRIRYTVLEIQFRYVKCTTATLGYAKISSNIQAMQVITMGRREQTT